jgi:hypothetical protein
MVLPLYSPAPNFFTRTICAQTNSLSPFYLERTGQRLVPHNSTRRRHTKAQHCPSDPVAEASGANLSASTKPLTIRDIHLLGSTTLIAVTDAGNSTPDSAFRYDAAAQSYIYNLDVRHYSSGRYGMSIYVGADRSFSYAVEFQVP